MKKFLVVFIFLFSSSLFTSLDEMEKRTMAAKDCVCKFIDHGNNSECIPTIKYSNKKCRDHYRELSKDIPNAHKDYRDRVCDNFYKEGVTLMERRRETK